MKATDTPSPIGETLALERLVEAHVRRAAEREPSRRSRRGALHTWATAAAAALSERFGAGIAVALFGSVLEEGRFRLDSDIDLAVEGLPADRFYEAWAVAEAAADGARLGLVRLEDAPDWLVAEVRERGQQLP